MPRRKKPHPIIAVVHDYIAEQVPELAESAIHLQLLDGPADAPRYAANVETCPADPCPYHVPPCVATAGQCPVRDCPLRCSLRLLLDRHGTVVSVRRGTTHWK